MSINKLLFSDFNVKNNFPLRNNTAITEENNENHKKNNTSKSHLLLSSLALLGVLTFAGVYMAKSGKKTGIVQKPTTAKVTGAIASVPENTSATPNQEVQKILYNVSDTLKFDAEYKSKLVKGLKEIFGVNKELKDIQSIMGKDEFQNIVPKYNQDSFFFHIDSFDFMKKVQIKRGIQNDYNFNKVDGNVFYVRDFENYMKYIKKELPDDLREEYFKPLIDGKFRVCLFGSIDYGITDTRVAAEKLLNQAVQYADKVAQKVNDGKPPFIIGVPDTTEFSQEIVRLLSENPNKYKNLKVILRDNKIYGSRFFINPFDKGFIEEEKLADKKFHEGLKELFKHFYVLPENEKIEYYSGILSNNETAIEEHIKKFRLFDDADWEKVLNNPNRKLSRNKEKNIEGIFESFLDLYRRPHYSETLKNDVLLAKDERTAIDNFLMRALNYPKHLLINPELKSKIYFIDSYRCMHPILDKTKLQGAYEDAVTFVKPEYKAIGYEAFAFDGMIYKYSTPQYLANDGMKINFRKSGDYRNPLIFINNVQDEYHLDKSDDLIQKMIKNIFPKGAKEIKFAEEMYVRTPKIKADYIFGDQIYITDALWQKIIS